MSSARTEKDSIGYMEVPEEAYYGVQSQRARDNFPLPVPSCIRILSAVWQKSKSSRYYQPQCPALKS